MSNLIGKHAVVTISAEQLQLGRYELLEGEFWHSFEVGDEVIIIPHDDLSNSAIQYYGKDVLHCQSVRDPDYHQYLAPRYLWIEE